MPAPKFNTWEGGLGDAGLELPRRPSIDDVGGDQKLDNDENPPDDVEHFTAGGWNQKAKQIAALARTAASCKLEVRFDGGGAPYVARATSPNSKITPATFSKVDNGNGDTTITWPADTFPPFACSPTGFTLLSSSTSVVTGQVEEIANGVRVRTHVAGVLTNVPWTLTLN